MLSLLRYEQEMGYRRLQYVSEERMISSLHSIAKSLETPPVSKSNEEILQALRSMKYIKEANSMFFTGTEAALTEIEKLCKQFDTPAPPPSSTTTPTGARAGTSLPPPNNTSRRCTYSTNVHHLRAKISHGRTAHLYSL